MLDNMLMREICILLKRFNHRSMCRHAILHCNKVRITLEGAIYVDVHYQIIVSGMKQISIQTFDRIGFCYNAQSSAGQMFVCV